jgi:hypothetical protein
VGFALLDSGDAIVVSQKVSMSPQAGLSDWTGVCTTRTRDAIGADHVGIAMKLPDEGLVRFFSAEVRFGGRRQLV